MAVSVMPMLIDPGTTNSGSAQVGFFGRSLRHASLEDVQYMRLCVGAEITSIGFGNTINYRVEYSVDAVDGVGGTWADLIPQTPEFEGAWEAKLTPWEIINPAASAVDRAWLRVLLTQSITGGSTNASFVEVQFR